LNQSSDGRLKKDITTLDGALGKVMQMRPVSYKWIQDDGETHLGFIAQELETVLPEIVHRPDNKQIDLQISDGRKPDPLGDTYAINYSKIIPVLTKAIQEQQKIIEELKAEIEILKNDKE
jgi:hypothetical protein